MTKASERWVLVTGAAKRLGRELALQFAQAGWQLLVHYGRSHAEARSVQAHIQSMGRSCHLLQADLSRPEQAADILQQAHDLAGAWPHCLVNSASIFELDDVQSASAQSLQRHFAVNVATPLLLTNALARQLRLQAARPVGACSAIHVLDQKVHNLNPDYFSYTVSKLALAQSVALQAQALAPQLRVCGVSPGLMYLSGAQTPENFRQASRVNLLHKPLQAAEVAKCAVFIAENTALNGTIIQADNGQHLLALQRDVMFAIDAADPVS